MKYLRIQFFIVGVLLAFGISFMITAGSDEDGQQLDIPKEAEIRLQSQLSGVFGDSTRELIAEHVLYAYAIVYLNKPTTSLAEFAALISDSSSAFRISRMSPRQTDEPTLFISERDNLRWKPIDEWGVNEEPPETWPHAFEVWLSSPEKGLLQNVLNAQTSLYEVAKATGGLIADIEARTVFDVDAWKEHRLHKWTGKYPYLPSQVTMTYLKKGIWYQARTMGMRKFGLPELTIAGFSASHLTGLDALMKLTCQTLIERPFLALDGRYRLCVSELAEPQLKAKLARIVGESAPGRIEIELALKKAVDGAANRNLEIRCLHLPGLTLMEKQEYLVMQLFGDSGHEGQSNH